MPTIQDAITPNANVELLGLVRQLMDHQKEILQKLEALKGHNAELCRELAEMKKLSSATAEAHTAERLTKKELATMLRVSERTVNRYLSAGVDLGKVTLPSGQLRFNRAKVETAMAQGRFKRR